MSSYPYTPIRVHWKRPPIDRELLARFMRRSDLQGVWHCLGVLAILAASGAVCYWFYSTGQWLLMVLARCTSTAVCSRSTRKPTNSRIAPCSERGG